MVERCLCSRIEHDKFWFDAELECVSYLLRGGGQTRCFTGLQAVVDEWLSRKTTFDFLVRFVATTPRFSVQKALRLTEVKLFMNTSIVFTKWKLKFLNVRRRSTDSICHAALYLILTATNIKILSTFKQGCVDQESLLNGSAFVSFSTLLTTWPHHTEVISIISFLTIFKKRFGGYYFLSRPLSPFEMQTWNFRNVSYAFHAKH